MHIYSHRVGTALDWLASGLRLFAKQWAKFLALFMALTLGLSLLVSLPGFLLLIASVLSIPIVQMMLFNAAHGTTIRGHFLLSDLFKKINTPTIWLRFLIASLMNMMVVYFLMSLTLPSIDLSMEQINAMSSAEIAQYASENLPLWNFFFGFMLISLYLLFMAWVFPLLSWESLNLLDAYRHSIQASFKNLLPLVFLWILLLCIMLMLILFTQYIALYFIRDISVAYLLMFFAVNTCSVILYTCQYTTYIGMFFESEQNKI